MQCSQKSEEVDPGFAGFVKDQFWKLFLKIHFEAVDTDEENESVSPMFVKKLKSSQSKYLSYIHKNPGNYENKWFAEYSKYSPEEV